MGTAHLSPALRWTDDESFESRYLSGRELYGDDFVGVDLQRWFDDEREGYADLGSGAADGGGTYGYHALNRRLGFRHLPRDRRFAHALGVGSARAEEFVPLADRVDAVTVLEPSDQLVGGALPSGVVPTYVKPEPSGLMSVASGTFDLVLCFGTLHHIPNVSTVVREIARVTAPDGWVLVREPVISMGDWRRPRKPGVTARERGIPRDLLVSMVQDAGLEVRRASWCCFPAVPRIGARLGRRAYDSAALTAIDSLASRLLSPAYRYHATSSWQKVRPTATFLVCQKPAAL